MRGRDTYASPQLPFCGAFIFEILSKIDLELRTILSTQINRIDELKEASDENFASCINASKTPSFFSGFLGCIWYVVWEFCIYDSPETHPTISKKEKKFITKTIAEKPFDPLVSPSQRVIYAFSNIDLFVSKIK